HSGMLRKFPEINLDRQQVGVFGKIVRLDSVVAEGDRVEIYREITADPELVERRDE
ncbi:MAG: RnfH family protein, partial [Gammaproteobacteria bacterium]|nr:RnfH family protein [Gammaproteobacteria bacterium]